MRKCANISCNNTVYNSKWKYCPSCYRKMKNGIPIDTGNELQGANMGAKKAEYSHRKKRCANPDCSEWVDDDWWSLCPSCYEKKNRGELVRTKNGWETVKPGQKVEPYHVYEKKTSLVTDDEARFLHNITLAVSSSFESNCMILPQVAFSAIVDRSDNSKFQNELNLVVDFLIASEQYEPLLIIEINDRTHKTMRSRMERDNKLKTICIEAHVPLIFLDGSIDATIPSSDEITREIKRAQQRAEDNNTYYLFKITGKAEELPETPAATEEYPIAQSLKLKAKPGSESISIPQTKHTSQITSKNGSVSKKKNARQPRVFFPSYGYQFLYYLALGLLGYVLGIVFCLVVSTYNTLGELFYDAVIFIGIPFGWTVLGDLLPESILLRGMIGMLLGSIAYPFVLIYYFIRMILEILFDHKNRQIGKTG